jgi:mRNA-degrading endonuclease RelE of RelBE toxin-antitoxin system
MLFEISLAPEAVADLRRLGARERSNVREAMEAHFRHEPAKVGKRRFKRFRGLSRPPYRLRVNELRIFYDVGVVQVLVLAIVKSSDAEAWLQEQGQSDEESPSDGGQG